MYKLRTPHTWCAGRFQYCRQFFQRIDNIHWCRSLVLLQEIYSCHIQANLVKKSWNELANLKNIEFSQNKHGFQQARGKLINSFLCSPIGWFLLNYIKQCLQVNLNFIIEKILLAGNIKFENIGFSQNKHSFQQARGKLINSFLCSPIGWFLLNYIW